MPRETGQCCQTFFPAPLQRPLTQWWVASPLFVLLLCSPCCQMERYHCIWHDVLMHVAYMYLYCCISLLCIVIQALVVHLYNGCRKCFIIVYDTQLCLIFTFMQHVQYFHVRTICENYLILNIMLQVTQCFKCIMRCTFSLK
jgi:hypothetical protein